SWWMAGYDSVDWQRQLQIAEPHLRRSFGLHPWQVLEMTEDKIQIEMSLLSQWLPKADMLGETGIDGFRAQDSVQMEKQERIFLQHLELNRTLQKPLVLHIVKSHERALQILKSYPYRGIVHGYSSSWETAKLYIHLGYKISVGRGVYHKGYNALKETVRKINLQDLVIESDAYVDPQEGPEDAVAIYMQVVEAVCQLKNISQQELQETVFHNISSL
ncbi:TatD family hydrolase, partial [bacterium]|nr:TatD family hydrolase [bacterium]